MFGPIGAPQIRRICPRHPQERPVPARCHQRHSRHVEDRGGPRAARAAAQSRCRPHIEEVAAARSQPRAAEGGVEIVRDAPARAHGRRRQARAQAGADQSLSPMRSSSRRKAARSRSRRATSRQCAEITIADTGIGIPAKDIEKLGRPFEQVENQFTKTRPARASASRSRGRWSSCMAARSRSPASRAAARR